MSLTRGPLTKWEGDKTVFLHTLAHTDRPVVVEMAQLVRQPLHVIRLQTTLVIYDIEVSGRHCALPDRLTDDKVIVPTQQTEVREMEVRTDGRGGGV